MNLSNLKTGLIFESLFISFVIGIIAAVITTGLAIRLDLLDRPNSEPHKKHKHPVPISGGTALVLSLLIGLLIFRKNISKQLWGLTFSSLIIYALGLYDDFRHLNWKFKLGGQIAGTAVLIILGIRTHLFDSALFSSRMPEKVCHLCDYGLTMFWVVFITNAYNLVDSADGLMIGISAWAEGFFIIAAMDAGQHEPALYCSILLGISLSLCFFNANPAFLFMGDSGAQTVGFLLAAIAIIYNPPELLQKNTWFLPILMLGVPIFDTTLVTISRWRKGQHFYHSGTDHTYHRLLRIGLSTHQAASFMHLGCFTLQSLAFFAISQSVIEANLIFAFVIICGIAAIVFLEREDLWKTVTKFIQKNEHLS
ncbi:MAG: undecaprenyl/decaprenyl-phosphate alpha-N-acetylglucosaminyl 1-phosphate transferase [Anaerolineaceae bacterium]|nr:undecaprenyl/decaprenyl-phosphate alpha-N-acetylglucosaminyl 1-phosphate transferase [Anaerolineaceae bacterium]